jgi:hypothetical protein
LCDVIVPEAKLGHAAALQPCRASLVSSLLALFAMLAAVELDRQPQFRTIEIENVGAGRMLPSEAEAV